MVTYADAFVEIARASLTPAAFAALHAKAVDQTRQALIAGATPRPKAGAEVGRWIGQVPAVREAVPAAPKGPDAAPERDETPIAWPPQVAQEVHGWLETMTSEVMEGLPAARPHAADRLKERFGIDATRGDLDAIGRLIEATGPDVKVLRKVFDTVLECEIPYRGKTLVVVYNLSRKRVITAHPKPLKAKHPPKRLRTGAKARGNPRSQRVPVEDLDA